MVVCPEVGFGPAVIVDEVPGSVIVLAYGATVGDATLQGEHVIGIDPLANDTGCIFPIRSIARENPTIGGLRNRGMRPGDFGMCGVGL